MLLPTELDQSKEFYKDKLNFEKAKLKLAISI